MKSDTDYFYINLANEWPGFAPGDRHQIEIESDGSLGLARANLDVFTQRGVFLGGPFDTLSELTPWYRLRVYADPLPERTHVQLFTLTADQDTIAFDPAADEPFPKPDWHAAPRDLLDILIPNSPARRLWVGGLLHSDGRASPALHQMRVDYGRDTWLKFLPALYAKGESQRDLIERFLTLHESVLGSHEEAIADLPRLFDPFAAPDSEPPSWLSWLSGWLDFELNEAWSEQEARENLAQAFQLYEKRGTLEGLRLYLKLYAGVEARIEEPALYTTLWTLGENSTLGFTTMLATAHPQGAVAGTTAALDESHVTRDNDFGAALFEEFAHHFCVKVYCTELRRPSSLDDVRTVIDREKPAHSTYELCLIEPRMRVGVQSRVGVDAIVAQGPPAAGIGIPLGTGTLAEHSITCKRASPKLPAGAMSCESEEGI